MRLCCGLLENIVYTARLEADAGAAGEGAVVVLEGDETLLPEDAVFGELSILDATPEEREGLRQAGYAMPDFDSGRASTSLQDLVAGKRGSGQGVADETSGFQC